MVSYGVCLKREDDVVKVRDVLGQRCAREAIAEQAETLWVSTCLLAGLNH